MWTGVGIFLVSLALKWILAPQVIMTWAYLVPGVLLAGLIHVFGFGRLAQKNSRRICDLESEAPCLFAFQAWYSYPLVVFKIGLGSVLRKYTPLPKPLLGVLDSGIGGGLGLASLYYYQAILGCRKGQEENSSDSGRNESAGS